MTRDELVKTASNIVTNVAKTNPRIRLVVVVTDMEGSYVGVAGSHGIEDVDALLTSALTGTQKQIHGTNDGTGWNEKGKPIKT